MDGLDQVWRSVRDYVSLMLDPWIALLGRVAALLHRRMDDAGIPYAWQSPLILAVVLFEVVLVVRFLTGWFRGVALVLTALTLAQVYGWLG